MKDFEFIETLRCVKCNHKEPLSSIKCVMDIAKSDHCCCSINSRYEQIKGQICGMFSEGPVSHGLTSPFWSATDLLQSQCADTRHAIQELESLCGCGRISVLL